MTAPSPAGETTLLLEVILPVPLDRSFTYLAPAEGPAPAAGDLVTVPFGRRRAVIGLVTGVREAAGAVTEVDGVRLKAAASVLPAAYRVDGDRRALLDWMAGYYALPAGEVLPLFHPPKPGTKGRASRHEAPEYPEAARTPEPTADQRAVLAHVSGLLAARDFGTVLLHGVTGSGKTEVYLQAARDALDRGRSVLILLPEIALTPQTQARVAGRLGDDVAVIHSALSAGERCRVHERAAAGEVRVVLGPRSALFAPVRDLGLVVVDEEHETSYKQDEKPRYHARHAALVRARAAGAAVILGSATPDLESYRNARDGRYHLAELRDRPVGSLPLVEVVDMRGQPSRDGFSERLLHLIEGSLARERQAIVYYNRRGYARTQQCSACGEAALCPSCDIALTVHLRPRRLLCHYCGFSRPVPDTCPACGHEETRPTGGGTEKVELSLQALFPEARVLRLDHDTTRRRGSHARILSDFLRGEGDILVGTQMVAKGHHFPRVDLVGVLAADDGLHLPDFRAQERAYQLLSQVAGRTGREDAGTVIFQTWQPEHPVLIAAACHDYAGFAAEELEHRRAVDYPPFRRMLRLGVTGRGLAAVEAAAAQLAGLLREHLTREDLTVLGPAPAVFPRLQDRHRHQILVKGELGTAQKAWLAEGVRVLKDRHRGVDVILDFDPAGLW